MPRTEVSSAFMLTIEHQLILVPPLDPVAREDEDIVLEHGHAEDAVRYPRRCCTEERGVLAVRQTGGREGVREVVERYDGQELARGEVERRVDVRVVLLAHPYQQANGRVVEREADCEWLQATVLVNCTTGKQLAHLRALHSKVTGALHREVFGPHELPPFLGREHPRDDLRRQPLRQCPYQAQEDRRVRRRDGTHVEVDRFTAREIRHERRDDRALDQEVNDTTLQGKVLTQSPPCIAYEEYPSTSVTRVSSIRLVSLTVHPFFCGVEENRNPGTLGMIT